jgi:hypothetical protein
MRASIGEPGSRRWAALPPLALETSVVPNVQLNGVPRQWATHRLTGGRSRPVLCFLF